MAGRGRLAAVACAAALAAAGCGATPIDAPPSRVPLDAPPPTPSAPVSAAPSATLAPDAAPALQAAAPTSAPAPDVEPGPGVLPRSVRYAMLTWTVTHAAVTAQDPRAYQAGVPGPATPRTSLVVDLEIRNDDVHVTFVTTSTRLLLRLPDGTETPGTALTRASAPPVSSVDVRYAFEVPAGTRFEGTALRWADPGREPSVDLPLAGAAPALEANVSTDIGIAMDLALPGIEMRWTVGRVLVGRDWPLPIGFKGGTLVPGARAETGHRWVGIVARVDVGRCDCKGGVLDQTGSARLLAGGLPYTPSAAETSGLILGPSTFSDVMLVFDVPATVSEATLQVGPLEDPAQQASTTIELGAVQ